MLCGNQVADCHWAGADGVIVGSAGALFCGVSRGSFGFKHKNWISAVA